MQKHRSNHTLLHMQTVHGHQHVPFAHLAAGVQNTLIAAAGTSSSSSSCELLAGSAAALPAALALPAGADWPDVLSPSSSSSSSGSGSGSSGSGSSSSTASGRVQLRSQAWLCFRGAAQWDAFGAASHALLQTGRAGEAAVVQSMLVATAVVS
jgi:hypothetical protein